MKLIKILIYIFFHPLNSKGKFKALHRFLKWQIATRLLPEASFFLPFVGTSGLIMRRGSTGATGNWYCGLDEFEDMSFCLHVLRPDDLFIDVGANIGSYSILVASGVGSNVIAIEPVLSTYKLLLQNIHLNDLSYLVSARNIGLSGKAGELLFTSDCDTINHVAVDGEILNAEYVTVSTLDEIYNNSMPLVLKIDCEGYEFEVLLGGKDTLKNPNLLAVILELNGSATRYGISDFEVDRMMLECGFKRYSYFPFKRQFIRLNGISRSERNSQNILYIRDIEVVENRIRSANRFTINNVSL